jgi:hypothetical protein
MPSREDQLRVKGSKLGSNPQGHPMEHCKLTQRDILTITTNENLERVVKGQLKIGKSYTKSSEPD